MQIIYFHHTLTNTLLFNTLQFLANLSNINHPTTHAMESRDTDSSIT